jgi:hypothetical protein
VTLPISGLTNKLLRKSLPWTSAQVSRLLKRLRAHGIIKKIARTFKYYATQTGRRLLLVPLKLREHLIIPSLVQTA